MNTHLNRESDQKKIKQYRRSLHRTHLFYGRIGSFIGIVALPMFYVKDKFITEYPYDTLIFRLVPFTVSILYLILFYSRLKKKKNIVTASYIVLMFCYYSMTIGIVITNFHGGPGYINQLITSLILILVIIYIFSPGLKRFLPLILGLPYVVLILFIYIKFDLTRFQFSLFFNPTVILCLLFFIGYFTEKTELENYITNFYLRKSQRSLKSEMKQKVSYMEQLEKCALLDEMTGVYNRNAADRILEKDLIKMKLSKTRFYLSYIDLNDLKYINDTKGHSEGDKYIVGFVNCITSQTRAEDILFRMGGDEFILLLRNISKRNFEDLIRRLLLICNDKGIYYSLGSVDHNDLKKLSPIELINLADRRMYLNKSKSKENL